MKTIRISRQGFPLSSMYSWTRFFMFVLSKKYNVVVDVENPDLVLCSNLLHYREGELDRFTGKPAKLYFNNQNVKMVYVSGEAADFYTPINQRDNTWAMGYQYMDHKKYYRLPSYVIDVWTMFDEARVSDSPFEWLRQPVKYDDVKSQLTGFCSVVQASDQSFRNRLFDALSTYKQVSSPGPWRPTVAAFDKHQWTREEYIGRADGLTYRQKMEFFKPYKFNMCMSYYGDTPGRIEEKLPHAWFVNTIPLYFGNSRIEDDGINPEKIINLHKYNDVGDCLDLVKQIDGDAALHKKYIESPIFVNNRLPDYFDMDRCLAFLETVVDA